MKAIQALVVASTFIAAAAQAAPVTYFGENLTPNQSVSGQPVTARNSFLSQLTGVGTANFTGLSSSTPPIALSFPGSSSGITATLTGAGSVSTDTGFGRFNTSSTGNQFYDVRGTFNISFSQSISAFGFYGTDIGDLNGRVTLSLTDVNNVVSVLTVPNTLNGPNGSLLFFGFIDQSNSYKSISFGNTAITTDSFGFDDLTLGDRGQITPTNPVPEPGSLALVGLGLAGLAALRKRKKG